jgi:hypothetical protein
MQLSPSLFTAQDVHFPAIFRVCEEIYLSGQIIVDL